MVLHINIVDSTDVLPFSLTLIEHGKPDRHLPILALSKNPFNVVDVVYEVTEFKNLSLKIEQSNNIVKPIIVKWGRVTSIEEEQPYINLVFTETNKIISLYNSEDYPYYQWSVGNYYFSLQYDSNEYYGGFKVNPTNIEDEHLLLLHETLEKKIEGLVLDYVNYKEDWNHSQNNQDMSIWHLIEWYENNQTLLLHHLSSIEVNSALSINKIYAIGKIPKRQDGKSFRWEQSLKGSIYRNHKYLNAESVTSEISDENITVKYFVNKILDKITDAENLILHLLQVLNTKIYELDIEIQKCEKHLQQAYYVKVTTEDFKKKYRNKKYLCEKRKEQIQKKISNYSIMLSNISHYKSTLAQKMNNRFWNQIKKTAIKRISIGDHASYKLIHKLFRESQLLMGYQGQTKLSVPVYKPTSVLYEYFVFFSIADIFIKNGFIFDEDNIVAQINTTFYTEGLKEGTTITFEKENLKVLIVYDLELEMNEKDAEETRRYFFTKKPNRKPDIRLDSYLLSNDTQEWEYHSSIVVEVKYSPLSNIYSENTETKAMAQMESYLDIRRLNIINGKRDEIEPFNFHPVKFVLCLYAGKNTLTNNASTFAACGKFIRYYPQSNTEIFGGEILEQEIFERWLQI